MGYDRNDPCLTCGERDDLIGDHNNDELIKEFTNWVEKYAIKVCPEGCLPTPAQVYEINLFVRIALALKEDRR